MSTIIIKAQAMNATTMDAASFGPSQSEMV